MQVTRIRQRDPLDQGESISVEIYGSGFLSSNISDYTLTFKIPKEEDSKKAKGSEKDAPKKEWEEDGTVTGTVTDYHHEALMEAEVKAAAEAVSGCRALVLTMRASDDTTVAAPIADGPGQIVKVEMKLTQTCAWHPPPQKADCMCK